MTGFATIVAAIDDITSAKGVLRLARRFADKGDDARIYAAHVVPTIEGSMFEILYPYACLGDDVEAIASDMMQSARSRLERDLRDELVKASVHELRLGYGSPGDALVALASSLGPDLLVGSRHDRREASSARLGGVVSTMAQRVGSPTLVVDPRVRSDRMKRLVVATDLAAGSAAILEWAISTATHLGATVHPIVCIPSHGAFDHAGLLKELGDGQVNGARKEAKQAFTRHVASLNLRFPEGSKLDSTLEALVTRVGDPGAELLAFAERVGADGVVIARCRSDRGSGLRLGRVAEYVLRNAEQHTLVLPPGDAREMM